MKGIIVTLSLLLGSYGFAGEQHLNQELAEEIAAHCSFMQITYFDINNDVLEPVEEAASEEACYKSLSQLIEDDRFRLLSEEQLYWYEDAQAHYSSLIDRPTIEDNYEDRPNFNEPADNNEDLTGRIEIEDNYSDEERPDFN